MSWPCMAERDATLTTPAYDKPLAPLAVAAAPSPDRHGRCAEEVSRRARRLDRPEMCDRLLPRQNRPGELRPVHGRALPQGARRLPLGDLRHGTWRLAHHGRGT